MRTKRNLQTILLAGIILWIFSVSLSAEQFGLTDEQFAVLKEAFAEYEKASDNFIALNRKACIENPELAAVQVSLFRVEWLDNSYNYPGEKEYKQFIENNKGTIDEKELSRRCSYLFESKAALNIFEDPNWTPEVRPAILGRFRLEHSRTHFPDAEEKFKKGLEEKHVTIFDPNDPNDEILWANIQNYYRELDEFNLSKQLQLLEDYNLPEKAALYPSTRGLYESQDFGITDFSKHILSMNVPKEVVKAVQEYEKEYRNINQKMREMNIEQPLLNFIPFLSSRNVQIDMQKAQNLNIADMWPVLRKYLEGTNDYLFEDEAMNNLSILTTGYQLAGYIKRECEL